MAVANTCCRLVEMINEKDSMLQTIILIGGGLHAGVIVDLINAISAIQPTYAVGGFYDDNEKSSKLLIPYLGTIDEFVHQFSKYEALLRASYIACIGNNITREQVVDKILKSIDKGLKLRWATLIHPFSYLSRSSSISHGTTVCAGATIGTNTKVGAHTIIDMHSSVSHDCCMGGFVHIAPGVHLCGGVNVGDLTLVGVGSQVIPEISIGQKNTIGAGTTVLADVGDSTKAVGIVKFSKKTISHDNDEHLRWLPEKRPNFSRVQHLLAESIHGNHFANFGPCVRKLENLLRNILKIKVDKAIILTCNGSASLHAIISGLEIFNQKKLKFVTQAFNFPTSVQGPLVGSKIVDIDQDAGLDLNQINVDSIDGMVVVNAFGHTVDMQKYIEWASQHQKYLILITQQLCSLTTKVSQRN